MGDRPDQAAPIVVVGGGMVGCVAAMYLARRFGRVDVLERTPESVALSTRGGRSLTVILSARGWRVLDDLGLAGRVRARCLPLTGRVAHLRDGSEHFTPYGLGGQRIWSVRRDELHRLLTSAARATSGVLVRYGSEVLAVNVDEPSVTMAQDGGARQVRYEHVIGCDGAHSVVRSALEAPGVLASGRQLALGYKEIDVRGTSGWQHGRTAFHYWPRENALFAAFPGREGGYHGSLFLPLAGSHPSFAATATPAAVRDLFDEQFGGLRRLIGDLQEQFQNRPASTITTVSCNRWVHEGTTVLLGDACHAMAPFMGHGMNCGFEDVRVLDECLTADGNWTAALAAYERRRRPDAEAIVAMSEDHYRHLASGPRAADPADVLFGRLCGLLPDRFTSPYERCAFSHDGYATVLRDWQAGRRFAHGLLAVHRHGLLTASDDQLRAAARALLPKYTQTKPMECEFS